MEKHEEHGGTHEATTLDAAEYAAHAHPTHPPTEKRGAFRHLGHNVADFRKRFWVSFVFTTPILTLSPSIFEFDLKKKSSGYSLICRETKSTCDPEDFSTKRRICPEKTGKTL